MPRRRLDAELVRRGLASTRAGAQEAVRAGRVKVGGTAATKPATLVEADAPLLIDAGRAAFVSRGGAKLEAALVRFEISVEGLVCLDAGASTGGFTDCLLRRGARRVYAVDVGYGQLAWELRTDARVTVMERTNVRTLRPADLDEVVELVVADLSFISLGLVLAPLAGLDPDRLVMLVKPQFEAGRGAVGSGGVVRDTSTWRRVLGEVLEAAATLGLVADGLMASPLRGPAGNVEFLLALRRGDADVPGGPPVDAAAVDAAIAEGEVLRG